MDLPFEDQPFSMGAAIKGVEVEPYDPDKEKKKMIERAQKAKEKKAEMKYNGPSKVKNKVAKEVEKDLPFE